MKLGVNWIADEPGIETETETEPETEADFELKLTHKTPSNH